MVEQSSRVDLVRQSGVRGDLHRHRLGPRQVLLVAAEVQDDLKLPPEALRANIVTRGLPIDDLESGTVLSLGEEAMVRLTHRCEVCSHLGRLSAIPDLRGLYGRRGYLAVVVSSGIVRLGEAIDVGEVRYNRVPDHVATRAMWVIRQIPAGRVVPFAMLVQLVGAPRGYLRALPRLVQAATRSGLPAHRVVASGGALLDYVPGQLERLTDEGVACADGQVLAVDGCIWRPYGLYLRQVRRMRAAGQRTMPLPAIA
jgi:alkylated DNA nucleotide flippase Atl1